MKKARIRFVRYLSALFILLFLFSGCGKERSLFKYALRDAYFSYPNGRGNCNAIQSDTDLFDPDDITLAFHYGRLKGTNTNVNVPHVDIYVQACEIKGYSYGMARKPIPDYGLAGEPYFVKRVEDNWQSEKFLCACSYAEDPTAHGVWEKITVPKEIFKEKEGLFTIYVQFPVTEEKSEHVPFSLILMEYEVLRSGRIRISFVER
ncbi:MAG: hypothetical protein J6R89_04325 [Clostridia bacterium]|nr:hypothetical protein [Clostridia bacterium]